MVTFEPREGLELSPKEKQALKSAWDGIQEEEPDEFDLQMIRDAEAAPDCKAFDT